MARILPLEPRQPPPPPTPEEVQHFIDQFQVLVLRRPTAARKIMEHVEEWVTEIVTESDS